MYVGLTRGRQANRLHVAAVDLGDAREQFTAALERDRADRGLREATELAKLAVAGIVTDGPVAVVNTERTRLRERIERAEQQAARWEDALAMLDQQSARNQAQRDEQTQRVEAADRHAAEVRAEVAAPLIEQATRDGTDYLIARERAIEADHAKTTAGRLRRRSATRTAAEANAAERDARARVRDRWARLPQSARALPEWAEAVAGQQAGTDPRVPEAAQDATQAHRDQQQLTSRHRAETDALHRRTLTRTTPTGLARGAAKLRRQAEQDRTDLARIEALPIPEAAQLARERAMQIDAERIAAEQAKDALDARAKQLGSAPTPRPDSGRRGPECDFGPSL